MVFENSGKKRILKTIRNLFQFFSMLIESSLLKGLVFYKYFLKRPPERQDDTVASNLLPRLLWLLPVPLNVSSDQDLVLSGINENDTYL